MEGPLLPLEGDGAMEAPLLPLEGDGAGLTDWTSGTGELTEQQALGK